MLGDLAEGTGESGTLQVDVKEAVDYATMDNLYSELYAMADVVGGAMRQENADADFRKNTILTTIDNFRAFAEVVLENLSAEKLAKGVDPKDHPDLVVDILHAMRDAEVVDLTEDEETDEKDENEGDENKDEKDASTEDSEEDRPNLDFNEVVTAFNESLNNFGSQLIESIKTSMKEISESNKKTSEAIKSVVEKVEEIDNRAVAMKSEIEEGESDTGSTMSQSDRLFKGTFFRSMSDFR